MTLVRYYPENTTTTRTNAWTPAVDVVERDDRYELVVDLPGLAKDDIAVKVHEGILTLTGDRKRPDQGENRYYRFERPTGTFVRTFTLPNDVDDSTINATYEHGVLSLELKKVAKAKPRTIAVS